MHTLSRFIILAVTGLGIVAEIASAKEVIIPIVGGPLQLGTSTAVLVDHSRNSVNIANITDSRALPISVFYPVGYHPCSGSYLSEYVPKVVSDFEDVYFEPAGDLADIVYSDFRSQMYRECAGGEHRPEYPVIIFSPGYQRTRLLYGALAQGVAKAGYVVVTIDHPYDADIIQYADGTLIYCDVNTTATFETLVEVRVKDVQFVLDQLSDKKTARGLIPYDIDVSKVGMYGHSAGGAAAINAMILDSRVIGGVNLDGSLYAPATVKGTSKPFLQFGEVGHTHFTDPTINETWPLLTGWHEELSFNGTRHSTFGDIAYLIHVLGLGHSGNESMDVGTVDGGRAMEVEQLVITDFFKFLFTGKESKLLRCDNEGYPEITCATTCIANVTCPG